MSVSGRPKPTGEMVNEAAVLKAYSFSNDGIV